ncbi:MAG: hypothetical protein ABUL60_10965 [Myxococcales bacterium]
MSSIPPSKQALSRALVEAWRADVPSPSELRRGYGRFTRKPRASQGLVRLASGLALGLLLGVGLAQAASAAHTRWVAAQEVAVRATAKKAVPARAAHGGTPLVPQPPLPATSESPVVSVTPTPSVAHTSVTSAVGPTTVAPATSGPGRSATSALDGTSRLTARSHPSAPYVEQQWQQAAAALRANDFAQAQSALLEVERNGGGSERDAARLARAQLLASHDRTAEAIVLLSDLSVHAQSSVVRDQSAGLLSRLRQKENQHRSTEPSPDIKQP